MIKVLLVDDHKVLIESLTYLLDQSNEIKVAGSSSKAEDALEKYRELKPDVVLMDLHFFDEKTKEPLLDGIEGLKRLKAYDPEAKVLILTSETSTKYLEKAMPLTDGYIIKDCSIEELIEAIKCCYRGLKIFDPLAISRMMAGEAKNNDPQEIPAKAPDLELSDKEIKIIHLIADGKTCKEIAGEFDLTEGYIRNMLINIYEKLGIESHKSTALVAYAAKKGLLG
ncbi:MAG: response regulator transcription factor [Firmicutes bacterium]|nr:response regulator transcription factor [Bacillota bacterium]